jgi:hypothetical protein
VRVACVEFIDRQTYPLKGQSGPRRFYDVDSTHEKVVLSTFYYSLNDTLSEIHISRKNQLLTDVSVNVFFMTLNIDRGLSH